jgi:hypothetical protein
MRASVVRHLLAASSSAEGSRPVTGLLKRQTQQRLLQLAVLRGNDANESHGVPLKALLVDAAGTLISPSEPVAEVKSVHLHERSTIGCICSCIGRSEDVTRPDIIHKRYLVICQHCHTH